MCLPLKYLLIFRAISNSEILPTHMGDKTTDAANLLTNYVLQ